jgi:hypothetical protein
MILLTLAACSHSSPNALPSSVEEKPIAALCSPCTEICKQPILVPSNIFELYHSFTVSTLPRVLIVFETASVMDSARALQKIHQDYAAGHFGDAYRDHESGIVSLVKKKSAEQPASEEEMRAFRRVLTGLYADAATGLQEIARTPPSDSFASAWKAQEGLMADLIRNASPSFEMSPEHKDAVCKVLAVYLQASATADSH